LRKNTNDSLCEEEWSRSRGKGGEGGEMGTVLDQKRAGPGGKKGRKIKIGLKKSLSPRGLTAAKFVSKEGYKECKQGRSKTAAL